MAALAMSLFFSSTRADSREDRIKCLRAGKIPSDERISSCTAALAAGIDGWINSRRAHYLRGSAYVAKGDFEAGVADFSEIIRLFPSDTQAYQARALAHHRHGDFDLAIADYTRVIEIDPKDSFAYAYYAYVYRGDAYADKGDLDHSIADASKAIDINPKIKYAYCIRGHAYARKGDVEHAIADFNQAIQLDPEYGAAYDGRAVAYKLKGDFDLAMADYNQLIRLDPKNPRAYRARGIAKFGAGSLSQALEDMNTSSALDPKDSYAALWLDLATKRSGQASRLPELAAQVDMSKWPAPIIRFLLGEITSPAMFEAAKDGNASKERGQLCEANFFSGELALQRGAKDEAVRTFRSIASDCPKTFFEYSAANAELKALEAKP
jgi:lipoprotein NlpI